MYALHYNGTRLKPSDIKKRGYFNASRLKPTKPSTKHLYAYAMGYRLTKDKALWDVTRSIAKGFGVGDLGPEPAKGCEIDRETTCSDAGVIFALLEIHKAAPRQAYFELATIVANNGLEAHIHNGFFVGSKDHLYTHFNNPLPLALLHLHATSRGLQATLPRYMCSAAYFHCRHDGRGRTYDGRVIYSRLRDKGSDG